MNNRERVKAILHYEPYDRMPLAHFGYWKETLDKWVAEGHLDLSPDGIKAAMDDGSAADAAVAAKLGFDFNWFTTLQDVAGFDALLPKFEEKVVMTFPDGTYHRMNDLGVIVLGRKDAGSIPAEIQHTLVDRASWEEHYLPRLQWSEERVDREGVAKALAAGADRQNPLGVYCGSLYGQIRDWIGVVGLSYLQADDEELYDEIIRTVAELQYRIVKSLLESGVTFDFAHFWEDICFKNGPLVHPEVFAEKVGPGYRRITDLCRRHGLDIVSLDCDGCIDALVPVFVENGVNTMFPIEVGTWDADIRPWRERFGRELRGVGGMRKYVFAQDFAAVDKEIERLRPLVDLGGFIPCPDHRISPDAEWDNVRYYCDRMRSVFG